MQTTVDRFGRIVIPKELRTELGLEAGSALELEERGGTIVLKPVTGSTELVEEDGVLVFVGPVASDLAGAVRRHREERINHLTPQGRRR